MNKDIRKQIAKIERQLERLKETLECAENARQQKVRDRAQPPKKREKFDILLAFEEGPATISELAARLRGTRGHLARLVKMAVKDGTVAKLGHRKTRGAKLAAVYGLPGQTAPQVLSNLEELVLSEISSGPKKVVEICDHIGYSKKSVRDALDWLVKDGRAKVVGSVKTIRAPATMYGLPSAGDVGTVLPLQTQILVLLKGGPLTTKQMMERTEYTGQSFSRIRTSGVLNGVVRVRPAPIKGRGKPQLIWELIPEDER